MKRFIGNKLYSKDPSSIQNDKTAKGKSLDDKSKQTEDSTQNPFLLTKEGQKAY